MKPIDALIVAAGRLQAVAGSDWNAFAQALNAYRVQALTDQLQVPLGDHGNHMAQARGRSLALTELGKAFVNPRVQAEKIIAQQEKN